ncbi:MAG: methyl-accepting chemotaxis protein [Pseudomonadota bacterium]
MMYYVLVFCAGVFLGTLALVPPLRRQRARVSQLLASQAEAAAAADAVADSRRLVGAELQADHQVARQRDAEMQARWTRMRSEFEDVQMALQTLREAQGGALDQAGALASSIDELQGAEIVFDRWHTDMKRLLDHNRHMHAKNDDFSQIVRQMVMVGLNASIEAAHAGPTGRGFGVVATEMRELSARAEALSTEYRKALYENDLITTTTFQDMQASGRMIIGAVRGLEFTNRKSMELLAAPAETA